jgi:hypothetical protein
LSLRGYPLLALTLLPVTVALCWHLARQRQVGAVFAWRSGEWTLQQGARCAPVSILRCSVSLSWVVFLAWTDVADATRGSVFLFADSAPASQLRGLRVRLTLER